MIRRCRLALCAVALLAAPFVSFCGQSQTISVNGVEGRGKDRTLALSDAFRNAISQALGTYVVTSRNWDGETLDKKIFDNSDAVVSKYKIVGEKEAGGRHTVVIDAEIVRNEMMKYIQKDTSTKVDGGDVANLLAKRNAINNAVKSLELLFQNWRENIYRVEKYGSLSVSADDNGDDETIHISVPFIVTFRWEAYNILLEKVRNVLSRIASAKTQGLYGKNQDGKLADLLSPFYIQAGLASKNEDYSNGLKFQNPNSYGEIRIATQLSDGMAGYEIYIVPNQVKKKLDSILQRDEEVRFSFTSKGGRTIARSSIVGKVYSSGWNPLYDCEEMWEGWPYSENLERIIIGDNIWTNLGSEETARQRLYHASVPVPLAEASQISGCDIAICQRNEDRSSYARAKVTSEPMDKAEWDRIDQRPQSQHVAKSVAAPQPKKVAPAQSNPAPSLPKPAPQPKATPRPPLEPQTEAEARSVLPAEDMALKGNVEKLAPQTPSVPVAGKWFQLAKEMESAELSQMALKASGAALFYAKKIDTYNSKVRPRLKDAPSFEQQFWTVCPACNGRKEISAKCSACGGTGACKYAGCNGGQKRIIGFDNTFSYRVCRECKGTARCNKCSGSGVTLQRCNQCLRKGKVLDAESALKAYQAYVEKMKGTFR